MKNNLLKLSRDWQSDCFPNEMEMLIMIRVSKTNIIFIGQSMYSLYLDMDYSIGIEMGQIINFTITETEEKNERLSSIDYYRFIVKGIKDEK